MEMKVYLNNKRFYKNFFIDSKDDCNILIQSLKTWNLTIQFSSSLHYHLTTTVTFTLFFDQLKFK